MTALPSFDSIVVAGGETRLRCYCCNDYLHTDDFRPDLFIDWFAREVERINGGRVCTNCMDAHVETEENDVVLQTAAIWDAREGEWHSEGWVR